MNNFQLLACCQLSKLTKDLIWWSSAWCLSSGMMTERCLTEWSMESFSNYPVSSSTPSPSMGPGYRWQIRLMWSLIDLQTAPNPHPAASSSSSPTRLYEWWCWQCLWTPCQAACHQVAGQHGESTVCLWLWVAISLLFTQWTSTLWYWTFVWFCFNVWLWTHWLEIRPLLCLNCLILSLQGKKASPSLPPPSGL